MTGKMQRRAVLTFLGGAGLLIPTVSKAQTVRIGLINITPAVSEQGLVSRLEELGYAIGRDLMIEKRYAEGNENRLPELVAELIRARCRLIVTASAAAVRVVQAADPAMPIVITGAADPIGSGLVDSLSRPGRNTTGVSLMATDLVPKRLELLREMLPALRQVAVLAYRPHPATGLLLSQAGRAAGALGISLLPFTVEVAEVEQAFVTLARQRPDALLVQQSTGFNAIRGRIAELAISASLPTMQEGRTFVSLGGLMAYGVNPIGLGRRAAEYVDKILRGARAGELPIEQGTKLDLVINVRTARLLNLSVPESLLVQADEVIE